MSHRYFIIFTLLLGLFPFSLIGQVQASLHALNSSFLADSKKVIVGLRLAHQAHWHTYWMQPGTGFPTKLTWQLPAGWRVDNILWPAPQRVYDTAKNLAGNGYEGVVYLPVTLLPPSNLIVGEPITLKAKAEWLMCKDVCMPGEAEVSVTLTPQASTPGYPADATDSIQGDELRATLANLPKPIPEKWQLKVTRVHGDKRALNFSLCAADGVAPVPENPWFFADDASVDYDAPQVRQAGLADHEYSAKLVLAEHVKDLPSRLQGVLTFSTEKAYLIDIPITESDPESLSSNATTATNNSVNLQGPESSFFAILGLAFFGGLILNLMPCVFPVLGLKVLGFVQQAGKNQKVVALHGLVFTSGVLLSFWLLATILALLKTSGQQLGWGFQLQEPAFVYVLGVVLLTFAINMSGVFEFGLGAMSVGGELQRKQGLVGSFFTGVLATVVATPCSAPFLAPALGAALALPTLTSFVVFTVIGVGLSMPYLILAIFPSALRVLPRPGQWMESFKQSMAFLLYGTVGLFIWILAGQIAAEALLAIVLALTGWAFALWLYGKATAPNATGKIRRLPLSISIICATLSLYFGWPLSTTEDEIVWEPWSTERVNTLRAEGRPIYVDFTARWCFTCQTNKKSVFDGPGSEQVHKIIAEKRVATLRADWTKRDALITAELKRWNRAAVPFNLLYLPSQAEPKQLPELLTANDVINAFKN